MTPPVLIAGVGNIFLGDDGFGVEVARRLCRQRLPPGVAAADFGVRGLHLAYELLSPPGLLIVVDAVSRGGEPGSLYLIEPELGAPAEVQSAHGMDLGAVFSRVEAMGGRLPRVRIVGCEPADLEEGMQLSPPVERAIPPALDLIHREVQHELAATAAKEGQR